VFLVFVLVELKIEMLGYLLFNARQRYQLLLHTISLQMMGLHLSANNNWRFSLQQHSNVVCLHASQGRRSSSRTRSSQSRPPLAQTPFQQLLYGELLGLRNKQSPSQGEGRSATNLPLARSLHILHILHIPQLHPLQGLIRI
jgi:hypothetical protein